MILLISLEEMEDELQELKKNKYPSVKNTNQGILSTAPIINVIKLIRPVII